MSPSESNDNIPFRQDVRTIPTLGGAALQLYVSRLITKALVAACVTVIFAIAQIFRHGLTLRYALLVCGGALSAIILFYYPALAIRNSGRPRRGLGPMAVGLGGFVSYLFGSYLFFYEGLWRLTLLFKSFSSSTTAVATFFVLMGYGVVLGIYNVSEFARAVDEGKIIIANTIQASSPRDYRGDPS